MGLQLPAGGGTVVRMRGTPILRWLLAALCAVLLSLAPAGAQTAAPATDVSALAVDISGALQHPLHLGLSDLQAAPPVEVEVTYITGHGEERAKFEGASLWALLNQAGLADGPRRRDHLQRGVMVTGRDGYAVLFAMGELDPDLEGKQIILADKRDGKTIEAKDGFRLVVPGDKHAARAVRDVVRIEVK